MSEVPVPSLLTGRFQQAFALACELHATQVRKGTTIPYLAHLMSVAALTLENGGSEDAAIAGLLHDAIEDSGDGAQTEARIRRGRRPDRLYRGRLLRRCRRAGAAQAAVAGA